MTTAEIVATEEIALHRSAGRPAGWAAMIGVSVGCHLLLALWIWQLPPAAKMRAALAVPFSSSDADAEAATGEAETEHTIPLEFGGSASVHNVDTDSRGQGGDGHGAVDFVLMVAGAHAVTLRDSAVNSRDASQIQRIRTSRDRFSWENRRATPNPNDQAFLASGEGVHAERRRVSVRDAREGARVAPESARLGGVRDAPRSGAGEAMPTVGGRSGSERESPGRGIASGRGTRASDAARVAHGRPPVDEGPAATLAQFAGHVQDDANAEQLASALLQRSLVDASQRGGVGGAGRGGIDAPGAEGTGGGQQAGGRASAYGPGSGAFPALDTRSHRYRTWYLAQRRRVEEALEFPVERALNLDQGTAVYRLIVRRDGTLDRPPRTVRSSRFDDLDAAALVAIREATPFAPLPDDLAPGAPTIRFDLTIEFSNPMVH